MSSPSASPSPSPSSSPSADLSSETLSFANLDTFTMLFILIVFLTLFIRLCAYFFPCHDQQNRNEANTSPNNRKNQNKGLPINIINSYHSFSYSKINVATMNKDIDTTCSICISDYTDSEMLRMMPQCRHCFHRDCVDEWLKVNGSCPICRNSLLKLRHEITIGSNNHHPS